MSPVAEALKEQYGDQLRLVYRHFPLITIHDNAVIAAEASEAAGAQDMFWEMHDILFEHQRDWSNLNEDQTISAFVGYAEEIGLTDIDQFQADLENHTYQEKVMAAYETAQQAGISSTPSFVVNGVNFPAESFGLSLPGLDTFIKLMQLEASGLWFPDGPEQVIDSDKSYQATIETENGDIVIELFSDTAPVNVNSFAFLAEQGWYENSSFHRVLPDFMAQGGDPTGSGVGFPGYRCGDEVATTRTFDGPGIVSLANSGANSNGGQFFITYGEAPHLNDGFTIIGQVIEGQAVVDQLTPRNPEENPTFAGDTIVNITVAEK